MATAIYGWFEIVIPKQSREQHAKHLQRLSGMRW